MNQPKPYPLDGVHDDLRGGMPQDVRDGWDCARANEDFYRMRNRLYLERSARREAQAEQDWDAQPKQYSRLTRRAVHCLTAKLYTPAPTRQFKGASGIDLESIYRECRIDSLMQRADRKATLNGVCAIQVYATGDPALPVRFYLWGKDEFHAYFHDDDPMAPGCVVTKSIVQGAKRGSKRRQYEVWTIETREVWQSKDFDPRFEPNQGTTAHQRVAAEPNPYGCVPFAYVWDELPVDRFDVDGVGTALREANGEIDRMLTDLACLLSAYNRPKGFARNVSRNFRESERVGAFTRLPASGDKDEAIGPPEVFYLQPQVDVISAWEHIHNYIDETFTDLDIPLESAKGSARWQGDASGIALVIKNQPLKDYLTARQGDYALYERGLARCTARVLGSYYDQPAVAAAAESLELEMEWPEVVFGPPGPDTDQHDQWSYQMGSDSLISIVMRQHGWSRAQAMEHLEQVAEDRAWEEGTLSAIVKPEPEPAPGEEAPPEDEETPPNDEGTDDEKDVDA